MSTIKTLIVTPAPKSSWRWITGHFLDKRFEWTFRFLDTASSLKRVIRAFRLHDRLSRYDVVISFDYFVSFGICARFFLSRAKTKHICYSFNRSRRVLQSGIAVFDRLINRIFGRADLFVVHSRHERELFHRMHEIPFEKLRFSHFAISVPKGKSNLFSQFDLPYVCLIGRNNRDVETFVAALSDLDVAGVVITNAETPDKNSVPDNIHVYRDLAMADCVDCLRHAIANVVLVKDADRGAGHITAVLAMLLGKPQIVSDVTPLQDYFIDGQHGIGVPVGDVSAVRAAIRTLLNDPVQSGTFGVNARRYAERWFGEQREARQLEFLVAAVLAGDAIPACDPEWEQAVLAPRTVEA